MTQHFAFGQNWQSFARRALTQARVNQARRDFADLTRGIEFRNNSFLDIGFGQGLALLLASEAGADVLGIDIDPGCGQALALTARQFPTLSLPPFQIASILDDALVESLVTQGGFAIVHSWGVLHHTGNMYHAFENAARLVKPGGALIVAIYNHHWTSYPWRYLKRTYNTLSATNQSRMLSLISFPMRLRMRTLGATDGASGRGMEFEHDLRDWLGGYPYEFASASQVTDFFARRHFSLERLIPVQGWTGCNQFVFKRDG